MLTDVVAKFLSLAIRTTVKFKEFSRSTVQIWKLNFTIIAAYLVNPTIPAG
jgi:hypothetical protein